MWQRTYGMVSTSEPLPKVVSDKLEQVYETKVEQKRVILDLEEHQLFYSLEEGKMNKAPLLIGVLDATCYDIDCDGIEELIVLMLASEKDFEGRHEAYGNALSIYDLSLAGNELQLHLRYTNEIGSQHPWMLAAGKLESGDAYGNLFVGVEKSTRFYQDVINRPFFFTWQGTFIERKWTGSYLSRNEYVDLCFVDFDGDGYDEVAALERREDGTYQVSLYKWLSFGFQHLITSKETYEDAEMIACERVAKGSKTIIWVKEKDGCKIVQF